VLFKNPRDVTVCQTDVLNVKMAVCRRSV